MSKRSMQERKPGEDPVVAKSKPTLSLVSRSVNRSPMRDSGVRNADPPGIDKSIARNAASSSQAWHQNENTCPSIEKSMAKADQRSSIEKLLRKKQNRLTETKLTHHNFEILTPHTFRKSSQKLSRPEEDQMLDLEVDDNESSNTLRREH